MKLNFSSIPDMLTVPAAFRRLCVETFVRFVSICAFYPAAFRRLCVETTFKGWAIVFNNQPPSGGCVLKLIYMLFARSYKLPAAFRRLCVETH